METVVVPRHLSKELKNISRDLGISREDFFTNAILYYLKTVRNRMALKEELSAWEMASEQDFHKFEKRL